MSRGAEPVEVTVGVAMKKSSQIGGEAREAKSMASWYCPCMVLRLAVDFLFLTGAGRGSICEA
eukprot:11011861-Alexandrium_andersonii.AAC.1